MPTDVDARRLYPGMISERDLRPPASTPAPSEFGQVARRMYPSMRSSAAPPPAQRTERAGFYKRTLTCDMKTGRLFYVDVPVRRSI